MSTLTSLKKLYNKLTGENSKASTNSEAINEITSADIGGDIKPLYIRFHVDFVQRTATTTTTDDEIYEAIKQGRPLIASTDGTVDDDGYTVESFTMPGYAYLDLRNDPGNIPSITFSVVTYEQYGTYVTTIYQSYGQWTCERRSL